MDRVDWSFFLVPKTDSPLRCLNAAEKDEVVHLRTQGDRRLCSLRKENLTSWNDPETERARHIFTLNGSEDSGDWFPITELPFRADKWCFTTVVLYNYLYIIGGYRQPVKRGWKFKMASLRFNPFTHTWVATAPLIKVRQSSSWWPACLTQIKTLPSPSAVTYITLMKTVTICCVHSTEGTSVQWPVKAVFTLWEAGTWTHWWPQTPAQLFIQL